MRRTTVLLAAVTTSALLGLTASPAFAQDAEVPEPASFTSMFTAMATPDMVLNADGVPTPGEAGATGTFNYRINSTDEVICYDITLRGVTPPYMSPARTATHIHQAAAGKAGPPRIAFPNPEDAGDGTLRSEGCMQGPFTTGIRANGADTGTGLTLDRIEADPAAYFTDTHTAKNAAGAVRGQLTAVPMGGVATGAGGTSSGESWAPTALGAVLLVGAAGAGAVVGHISGGPAADMPDRGRPGDHGLPGVRTSGPGRAVLVAAVSAFILVSGCGPPAVPAPPVAVAAAPAAAAVARVTDPVSLRIPAIDVDSPLPPLGIAPDGAAEVPTDYALAGWFSGGGGPGSRGPTVLLGHVDSRTGPAVFYRLRDLREGDGIELTAVDGTVVRYTVERTEQVPKDRFPTFAVFGATPDDVLRLVTCGGEFDRGARSYEDNLVVHARRT